MIFRICEHKERILCPRNIVRLLVDNWDDFHYKTTLYVTFFDPLAGNSTWEQSKLAWLA